MLDFFKQYVNILPYSSIAEFVAYEKLSEEDKNKVTSPLYSSIQAIESLLLDKIESLKTDEEIADCLRQYLNKTYIIEDENVLDELQNELPQNITDEDFFRRYSQILDLSSLLEWYHGNHTTFETQEDINNYIQSKINDLLEVTNPEDLYQLILKSITEWNDKTNDINKNIENLLNFLVGTKDVLNPLKNNNYEDLKSFYSPINNYNNVKEVLANYIENKNK